MTIQKITDLEKTKAILEKRLTRLYRRLKKIEIKILSNEFKVGIQYSNKNKILNKKAFIINCIIIPNIKAKLYGIGKELSKMDFYCMSRFNLNHPEFDENEFSKMLERFAEQSQTLEEQKKRNQEEEDWVKHFLGEHEALPKTIKNNI